MKKITSYFKPVNKPLTDLTNTPPKKKLKTSHIAVNSPVFEIPSSPTTNSSSTVNPFFPQIINSTSTMSVSTAAALENDAKDFGESRKRKIENVSDNSETASIIEISDDAVAKTDLADKTAFVTKRPS